MLLIRPNGCYLCIASLLILCSCGSSAEEETADISFQTRIDNIETLESRFMHLIENNPSSAEINITVLRLVEEYRQFADFHPNNEFTPEMLFRAANLRADALGEHQGALNLFRRIRRDYPDSPQAERSLFLIGYTQAELMKNYDDARQTYEEFLETYPESDLAESVRMELQYLGMDIDDILNGLDLEE